MKKLSSLLVLFLATAVCYGQNSREIKAVSGSTYVEKQEAYTPSFKNDGSRRTVRNIILLIGDGMGTGAINAAMYANGGELTMTGLKTMGYVRTQSADNFTTDSAASGTAYATGHKTRNGFLGVDTAAVEIKNLPEKLAPLGFACGVVSTDELDGATPAAFFAHQRSRGASEEIWADLAESSLSFASAGSRKNFENQPLKTRDSISEAFEVVYSCDDEDIDGSDRLLYLPESVKYDERGSYLPETTEMAIEYLSERGGKGFFLMVEGARIDKEEHANNFDGMVKETLDFDKAVEAAIRFAERDGHTLVIISADHETGAVTLGNCNPSDGYASGVFATSGHSPIMVPLFAYDPHSREFTGTQENSDVGNKIFTILAGKAAE